jgi:phosphate transport system substrate-binding protein
VYFKDEVLRGADFTPRAQTLPGTAAVVNAVAKDKLGMGYGGAAFAKGIKLLKVRREAGAPALVPTAATVADGSYALTRPLYFYLRSKASGDVAAFIDWALSPAARPSPPRRATFP